MNRGPPQEWLGEWAASCNMCFDDGHCLSVWLFVGVLFVGVGSQARTARVARERLPEDLREFENAWLSKNEDQSDVGGEPAHDIEGHASAVCCVWRHAGSLCIYLLLHELGRRGLGFQPPNMDGHSKTCS